MIVLSCEASQKKLFPKGAHLLIQQAVAAAADQKIILVMWQRELRDMITRVRAPFSTSLQRFQLQAIHSIDSFSVASHLSWGHLSRGSEGSRCSAENTKPTFCKPSSCNSPNSTNQVTCSRESLSGLVSYGELIVLLCMG